jgi:hypothetical protein
MTSLMKTLGPVPFLVAGTLFGTLAGCGASTSSGATSTTGSTSTSSGAATTYAADAQPIYEAKCAPCHTTGDDGTSDFASSYADTQASPDLTVAPECASVSTVGACTLIRIKSGVMPLNAGCTGDPSKDVAKPACLTAAEQATLEAWITGGEAE